MKGIYKMYLNYFEMSSTSHFPYLSLVPLLSWTWRIKYLPRQNVNLNKNFQNKQRTKNKKQYQLITFSLRPLNNKIKYEIYIPCSYRPCEEDHCVNKGPNYVPYWNAHARWPKPSGFWTRTRTYTRMCGTHTLRTSWAGDLWHDGYGFLTDGNNEPRRYTHKPNHHPEVSKRRARI